METVIVLVSVLILGLAAIIFFINHKLNQIRSFNQNNQELIKIFELLKNNSLEDRRLLLESLQKNTNSLNERLDNAVKVIASVQRNLGEMAEIGRGIKELQEFLKNPKLRGRMGEHILNQLLTQMLPKQSFHLQYSFRSGEKVDAAVITSAGIIPIDSKFPMENFRKMMDAQDTESRKTYEKAFENDVKRHMEAISRKYILIEEGTIDYALMYVPSEAVYYEIVNNTKLFEYAGEKKVLPVSPTTFYAFLKAILMSFEGQKIEEKAREILSTVKAIQKEYDTVEENLGVLQRHITNANNMLANVLISFRLLGQKISSTKMIGDRLGKENQDKVLQG
ncbi:MAG: DNA recombination protein RmuC [Patescibacteria group bacterium]|nr:DNA recombination protein RmuC [Patescibacteria group bacterium]